MKGPQIAEHLCVVQAGSSAVECPIGLPAGIFEDCKASISAPKFAAEGILKAKNFGLVF